MKLFKRIIKYLLILIGGAGLAIVIAINVSPRPFVFFLNHAAKDEAAIRPRAYQSYRDQISIKKDVRYSSQSAKNTMDIFYKKDNRTKPTIIWAHGGAFVAGDKSGTTYWATKMAANGYNVVSINYPLAPDRQYPTQVNQMREAIQFVHRNYAKQLNVQKVVVGGDSAGAHIASQVIAAQYNHQLATAINYHHLRDVKIVGGLLYCGPYDIKQMVNKKHVDTMTKLFVNQVGWAYLGDKDWKNSAKGRLVSTVSYVNKQFPPIFITDGNNGSFEAQGKELYHKLREEGVATQALFFGKERKVNHEYQFDLDSRAGKECFEDTQDFLKNLD